MFNDEEIKEKIKEFYEKSELVWPENDGWHKINQQTIYHFLHSLTFSKGANVLNAGSGGNNYNLSCNMHHLDIVANKIKHLNQSKVGSVEAIPYGDAEFDATICVGSILNYCDATLAISELSRTLKIGGQLILEFETSYSYEYINTNAYKKNAAIASTMYFDEPHRMWVYALKYIINILKENSLIVDKTLKYHILSGLAYRLCKDENRASKYALLDGILRHVPFISQHAANVILLCTKS